MIGIKDAAPASRQAFGKPMEKAMQVSEIQDYARRLFDEIGPKAIATAAHRAREAEDAGDAAEAEKWRKIEEALLEMRGPHQG